MGRRNRIRPYAVTYIPASFHYLGSREMCVCVCVFFFRCARVSVSVKETSPLDDAKYEGITYTELYRGERSIDYPVQGNPYNTLWSGLVCVFCGQCTTQVKSSPIYGSNRLQVKPLRTCLYFPLKPSYFHTKLQ